MDKLRFTTDISAPAEVVWSTMLDPDSYREWTGAFHEGSYFEGAWTEGSPIRFLGTNDDGTVGGLVGIIAQSEPHRFVSVRYVGEIDRGVESRDASIVGAFENYSFDENGGVTTLTVDLDSPVEYSPMMNEYWPLALAKLKELAEA